MINLFSVTMGSSFFIMSSLSSDMRNTKFGVLSYPQKKEIDASF
jgi:hypothetical protein